MIARPKIPDPGSRQIPHDYLRALDAYLKAITPQDSVDIHSQVRPGGTSYLINKRSSSAGAPTVHPYQGFDASEGSTPKIIIRLGAHDSVVPKIGSTELSADLNENVLTLSSGDTKVWVKLTTEQIEGTLARRVTSALIESGTEVPANTEEYAYQLLMGVLIAINEGEASVTIAQAITTSIAYEFCGGTHKFGDT